MNVEKIKYASKVITYGTTLCEDLEKGNLTGAMAVFGHLAKDCPKTIAKWLENGLNDYMANVLNTSFGRCAEVEEPLEVKEQTDYDKYFDELTNKRVLKRVSQPARAVETFVRAIKAGECNMNEATLFGAVYGMTQRDLKQTIMDNADLLCTETPTYKSAEDCTDGRKHGFGCYCINVKSLCEYLEMSGHEKRISLPLY